MPIILHKVNICMKKLNNAALFLSTRNYKYLRVGSQWESARAKAH